MKTITAGYGDAETWGPCMNHPHDPRTLFDEFDEFDELEMTVHELLCLPTECLGYEEVARLYAHFWQMHKDTREGSGNNLHAKDEMDRYAMRMDELREELQ